MADMESGTSPPDRPSDQPGGEPPPPPPGPQSPAPGGPESPAPPLAPQSPAGPGPQSPPSPGAAPSYGGPVPPGGWQTPAPAAPSPWAGAPLAGWGTRVGATLLDSLILTIPVVILSIIIVAVAAGSDSGAIVTGILGLLAFLIVALFYAPVLMARDGAHNGQTWGKQIVDIRVVRDTGQPFDLGSGFVREFAVKGLLLGVLGSAFAGIPVLIDWLWPLWDDQNRTLHDMIVKTHVMRA
jgi:uncharacterized RDD family membrane protein YckC